MNELFSSLDSVAKVLATASFFTTALVSWAIWSLQRVVVTEHRFSRFLMEHESVHSELERRLAAGDHRFAALDAALGHFPRREDIAELRLSLEKLSGDMRATQAELQKVAHPVAMLLQNALSGD